MVFFISCGLQWLKVINQRNKSYSVMSNIASFPNRSLPSSSECRRVYGLIWCLVGKPFEVPGEIVNPCSSRKLGYNCRVILYYTGPVSDTTSLLLVQPLTAPAALPVRSTQASPTSCRHSLPLPLLGSLFWATCLLLPALGLLSFLAHATQRA